MIFSKLEYRGTRRTFKRMYICKAMYSLLRDNSMSAVFFDKIIFNIFMRFRVWLFVFMCTGGYCTTIFAQTTGTVKIVMHGMKNNAGIMRVALFSEHNIFPSEKPDFGGTAHIHTMEATMEFHNVPYGYYAISVFHDENANAKLDLGLFGPLERYGFSNGARGFLGPPSFDKAKAAFHEAHKTYVVEVK